MYRKPTLLLLCWLWVLPWTGGCRSSEPQRKHAKPSPKPKEVVAMPKDCLEKFTIDQGNTYLDEIRGPHKTQLYDWQKAIKAEQIKDGVHLPASCTKDYKVGSRPMFYFSPGSKEMVVDAKHFSELKVADATRVKAGQRTVVGRATPAVLEAVPRRKLARFLLQATAIHTYWHIKADLCLVKEEQPEGGPYRAHFQGAHLYFTNERNEDPISFGVEITKEGELALLGGKS